MAMTVHVAGAALIQVGTGAADALEDLGYSANGVNIQEQTRTEDIPGDENGGDAGVPIDIQRFGEEHFVEIEFTKWDAAVMAKVEAKFKGDTAGTSGTVGLLYGGDDGAYRLLINSANFVRNYLAALPTEPQRINVGSRHSRKVLAFRCLPKDGVLFDTNTT